MQIENQKSKSKTKQLKVKQDTIETPKSFLKEILKTNTPETEKLHKHYTRKIKKIQEENKEHLKTVEKRLLGEIDKASRSYLQDFTLEQKARGRPQAVNYNTLLQIYKKESWVRSCVDVIKRTATSGGFKIRGINGVKPEDIDGKRLQPLIDLLKSPNPRSSITDIFSDIIIDLMIYGDHFIEKVKDKNGIVREIYNLFTPSIRVLVSEHGELLGYIQGRELSKNAVIWNPHEIIHWRLNNPGNEIYGLSPLESLFIPVETDLWAQAYNKNFFKNNATPRLHLDMGNCTRVQLERNRKYWEVNVQGAENAHKTIITEGGAKMNVIGTPPKDMEFQEQRKFNRDEICAVFGVPPVKVGIYESANRASAKEEDVNFKKELIIPLQRLILEKFNNGLLKDFDLSEEVELYCSELDLRDETDQVKIDRHNVETGILTINEIRARRGLGPVAWGDKPPNEKPRKFFGEEQEADRVAAGEKALNKSIVIELD